MRASWPAAVQVAANVMSAMRVWEPRGERVPPLAGVDVGRDVGLAHASEHLALEVPQAPGQRATGMPQLVDEPRP